MPTTISLSHVTTVPQSLGFLKGQVEYMKARGIRVEAISSPGEKLTDFGESEGVDTHALEMARRITPLADLKSIAILARHFRQQQPAIVHAHTPKGGLLGMLSAFLARVPIRVYHMRGLPYMTATGRRRRLLQITEKISCLLAHRVFCVSHSIREVAVRDGICSPEKIVVFEGGSGNGVDARGRFDPSKTTGADRVSQRKALGIPKDAPVALFVGRIVRDKGVDELARAWALVRKELPESWLVLAGPPEAQDPISEESRAFLAEDDHVVMTGAVNDTVPIYALSDVVVLPTHREGFPNVLLEAGAMARPVVATRIPGCIDAVDDGVTGTLVSVGDVGALARGVHRYLTDPQLRLLHGNAGREWVMDRFRQEIIWESIFREYSSLLEANGFTLSNSSPT